MSAFGAMVHLTRGKSDESPAWDEFSFCRELPTSGCMKSKSRRKKPTEAGVRKAGEQRVREFNERIPTDG